MEVGIGLPATIPGARGDTVVDWARRAEARGYSTLGVVDRIAYDNYEPLATLAAAAAVTERIRLTTSILLGALRGSPTVLAKQLATIDRLSSGRLVLGVGVGRRVDDYSESGVDFSHRGALLDALLERVTAVWHGEVPSVGPVPTAPGGPEILIGGDSPGAYRRMVRFGSGWIAGGGFGDVFRAGASRAREAWTTGGREESPRLAALSYFSLGNDARPAADRYLKDYYGFLGAFADQIAAGALVTPEAVAQRVAEFTEAGCDELILFPCIASVEQVDLLADALGL